jgi:hypothetical protein
VWSAEWFDVDSGRNLSLLSPEPGSRADSFCTPDSPPAERDLQARWYAVGEPEGPCPRGCSWKPYQYIERGGPHYVVRDGTRVVEVHYKAATHSRRARRLRN